ncbi:unnamed protein product, partial [Ectocarpus sp. 12 AP-2014]
CCRPWCCHCICRREQPPSHGGRQNGPWSRFCYAFLRHPRPRIW